MGELRQLRVEDVLGSPGGLYAFLGGVNSDGLGHYQGAMDQALSCLVRRVVVRTLWQYLTGRMCQNSGGIQGPTKGSVGKSLQNSASALRRAHASQLL